MGRALLKKRAAAAQAQGGSIQDDFEIEGRLEQVIRQARAKEKELEKRQKHVEYLAWHGMDGPRPCLFQGGRAL